LSGFRREFEIFEALLAEFRHLRSQLPTKPQPGKKPLTGVPFRHITTSV
jgi:hypothetical protein